jgi:hypothetical protein
MCLLQEKYFGVQPFIAANKTKQNKTESKNKYAPRKHIAYEATKK